MNIPSLLLVGTLGLASVAGSVQDRTPAHERVDPGRFFARNCAACHAVPDTELATDRAWLDQVRRTS